MRAIEMALRAAGCASEEDPLSAASALGIRVHVVDDARVFGARADAFVRDGVPCVTVRASDPEIGYAIGVGVGLALTAQLGLPPVHTTEIARAFAGRFSGPRAASVSAMAAAGGSAAAAMVA